MAEIIYANPENDDILLNEDGDIAGGEEAECTCCCDCETGGPTADFSTDQVSAEADGSECCIEFFDESTPGTCGEIVEHFWDFGDENTSTEEQPTHCYDGTGPWDVTHTVTDSAGCNDTVVSSVGPCIPTTPDCDSYPNKWNVSVDGMLSKPNASSLLAFPAVTTDVGSRIVCVDFSGGQYFCPFDYTPMDGSYLVPYASTGGGITSWTLSNVLEYELWQRSGAAIVSLGLQDNTELTITATGCVVGPGDVTITGEISQIGVSPRDVNAWSKTITLLPGQQLLDLGSISLDPVLPAYPSAANYHGLNYPKTDPLVCTPDSGSYPNAYPGPLVISPAA